jgi:hypothetical protein
MYALIRMGTVYHGSRYRVPDPDRVRLSMITGERIGIRAISLFEIAYGELPKNHDSDPDPDSNSNVNYQIHIRM